jgi:hypothetical protein
MIKLILAASTKEKGLRERELAQALQKLLEV